MMKKYFVCCLVVGLFGCGSIEKISEARKVDYKSATKLKPLDIPPDLVAPGTDERFIVPDLPSRGAVSALGASGATTNAGQASGSSVLPAVPTVRLERAGQQRWLVASLTPEQLWPQLKEFWEQSGFKLVIDTPEIGVLETEWAENRANIPQSGLRGLIGKAFAGIYTTAQLDKFRTRLERTEQGTEIYISHRGQEEVYTNAQQDRTVWQARPRDPELEAEFLGRLLVKLGAADEKQAKKLMTAQAGQAPERIQLLDAGQRLQLVESFDRAWRRVGLALDRIGFAVEDRDRSKGTYFVKYLDPDLPNEQPKKDKGLFQGWFGGSKTTEKRLQAQPRYRIVLNAAASGDQALSIVVLGANDEAVSPDIAKRILGLLSDELK